MKQFLDRAKEGEVIDSEVGSAQADFFEQFGMDKKVVEEAKKDFEEAKKKIEVCFHCLLIFRIFTQYFHGCVRKELESTKIQLLLLKQILNL